VPYHVCHPSFEGPDAEREYGPVPAPPDFLSFPQKHLPDEITRDLARRMHHAAYRWQHSTTPREAGRWRHHYYALRDRIILGNHKLVFRAVGRAEWARHWDEDLIGDCHVVLIQAVEAYNPWLGVRFSTYAFTCLKRALARLRRRLTARKPVASLSAEVAAAYAPGGSHAGDSWHPVLRYLVRNDPLLSQREKVVLERRYQLTGQAEKPTLERLGQELGLSKERVRQLQNSALGKLRQALLDAAGTAQG
jgi:hypothetical protein